MQNKENEGIGVIFFRLPVLYICIYEQLNNLSNWYCASDKEGMVVKGEKNIHILFMQI